VKDSNANDIKRLIDKVNILSQTGENKRRKLLWEKKKVIGLNHWRGIPLDSRKTGKVPIIVELENEFWVKILKYNIYDIYNDPLVYLKFNLEKKIKKFEIIKDDTPINLSIPIQLSTTFEAEIFGLKIRISNHTEPNSDMIPIVRERKDIDRIGKIDFYSNDIMRKAHMYFDVISKLVGKDVDLRFPEFSRSPFAVAMHLRGVENILCDMMKDCDFAKDLINFVAVSRDIWWKEWSKYFNQEIPRQNIYNDEVNCPLLAPSQYREFAFPSEKEIERKYKIKYWHSCGDTTKLLADISKLDNLDVFHVGPWTDLKQVLDTFSGKNTALEICLHPIRDVLKCAEPRLKILKVLKTCNNKLPFYIRIDALQSMQKVEETLKTIQDRIKIITPLLELAE